MKRKYIWLNPVVMSSYPLLLLEQKIKSAGFVRVEPVNDYISIVKNKYRKLLDLSVDSDTPVLDNRCPLMVDYCLRQDILVNVADIDPILIHIAKELANRNDLKDGQIFIITPCLSLKLFGKNLKLERVVFMTWDEWVECYGAVETSKSLDDSPIPLGFFGEIEKSVLSITNNNLNLLFTDLSKYRLVEGLYCEKGCHNGDGVTCLKK